MFSYERMMQPFLLPKTLVQERINLVRLQSFSECGPQIFFGCDEVLYLCSLLQFLRALWFALHERVSCLDELDMCTTRLRLLLPGEPVTDDVHVIHPLQVKYTLLMPSMQYFRALFNECRKATTKAITLTNHSGRKQRNEPIRIRSNYMWPPLVPFPRWGSKAVLRFRLICYFLHGIVGVGGVNPWWQR